MKDVRTDAKVGNVARSLALLLGTRWDAAGDLGTDIAALLAAIGGGTRIVLTTTINDGAPAVTDFNMAGGINANDLYAGCWCLMTSGARAGECHMVSSYVGATKNVSFLAGDQWQVAPANGDALVLIVGPQGLSHMHAQVDDLIARLTALRAGYLDNINQAGLLQLTAARAGYIDELGAANIPADIDGLTTRSGRVVLMKEQWCDPSSILPTLAFSNVAADKDFPNVVLPAAGTFLPAGAVIHSAYLMLKWRKQYNSSGAANAINAANKTIRIKKAADAWNATLVAMTMANGDWETVAGPAPAGVEGGDMIIGSVDIAGKVSALGTTYNIRSDQTTNADGITVTAASLTLYSVATGLKIYYTLA